MIQNRNSDIKHPGFESHAIADTHTRFFPQRGRDLRPGSVIVHLRKLFHAFTRISEYYSLGIDNRNSDIRFRDSFFYLLLETLVIIQKRDCHLANKDGLPGQRALELQKIAFLEKMGKRPVADKQNEDKYNAIQREKAFGKTDLWKSHFILRRSGSRHSEL